ncbi:hypothetical protein VTO73DRAFT_5200 [Trametes versicolor]
MLRHKSTLPASSHVAEDAEEGTTERVEDPSDSDDTQPRKKVRWDGNVDTPDEDETEESSTTNVAEKICLAASCQSGRVACAYYDPVRRTVFIFEDTPENQHFDLTKTFLEQTCPDVVLTSSKADDNFMDVCRDHMDGSGGTFQVRPQKDFLPLKGRDRLLSLRLLSELPIMQGSESDNLPELGSASEPRNAYDFMRRRREIGGDPTLHKWNASVRLANFASVESSPLCLGSIGALLDYLARTRAVAELDDEGVGGLEVLNIELLPLLDVMQINADALFSLQIFEDENHASIHSDKTKEGLSLFGILNNTKTTLGRALMREWFLRPSMSLAIINARHDAVECFTRADNIITATAMHGHIQGTKNLPRIITTMRSGKAKVSDWQSIVKFAFHALLLRDSCAELNHAGGVDIVRKLLEVLDVASFRELGNTVNETIDWEESTNAARVCVRPHIDEELDNLKHIYHGIDAVLSKVATQISATVPLDYASSLNVVYFPQLGFLVCVPMQDEWRGDAGITVLDGWSFQFCSDSHVYFKSQEMQDIKQGRHPLQELVVDTFVPNDAFLLGGSGIGVETEVHVEDNNSEEPHEDRHCLKNSIIVCTGANACGKSIYLKQIALIQYMAQVQSAFMIDLNQVSLSLRNCTARSLIILDEFGKGTLPAGSCLYGSGLFCGVLKYLLESGTSCPKVIATTHFHEIFHNDLLNPHKLPITFLHMQVLLASSGTNAGVLGEHTLEGSDDEDATRLAPSDKITYLYK